MGLRERAAWYVHIERRTDLPAELRASMREQVQAFDRLLSQVLGTMELHYLRWSQSPEVLKNGIAWKSPTSSFPSRDHEE